MNTLSQEINNSSKVTNEHRDRLAFVYVRQSSFFQVEHHLESQRRQYDFHKTALELGWPKEKVVVVDEDQGQSGSSPGARSGFGRIIMGVGAGEVGIVMSLEASQLPSRVGWNRGATVTRTGLVAISGLVGACIRIWRWVSSPIPPPRVARGTACHLRARR